MVRCPKCSEAQTLQLCCSNCGSPLGVDLDGFAVLGLDPKLVIDLPRLEQTYHERGRQVHPDRFADERANVRTASLKSTANLTRAYRALRDPVSRGLYWLELHGRKLSDGNQSVPPDLATTVFAIHEELAELRDAGANDATAALREGVEGRRLEVQTALDKALMDLNANFAAWDRRVAGREETLFEALKSVLARIAYLRTLLRDISHALEIAQAA
jgi:DnaJ-domain-containing protein 1